MVLPLLKDSLTYRPVETLPPLAAALAALDIEPFDPEAIVDYKIKKKEETFLRVLPESYRFPGGSYYASPSDPVGILGSPLRACWVLDPHTTKLARDRRAWFGMTREEQYFAAFAMREGFDLRFYRDANGYNLPHAVMLRWRRMSIAEAVAGAGVPDYVMHKANQVLEKVPDARIEVDTLESHWSKAYDPFLVVSLGTETYYIEVWGDDDREFTR